MVAFTKQCGSFIGMRYITRFGLFVWLGCFTSTCFIWSDCPPQDFCIDGGLGDICQPIQPPPERFIGASLLIPTHQVRCTAAWWTAWPSPGSRWTWQAWSSCNGYFFWLSYRIFRSAVLSSSCPSYLWWAAVSGPVIAQRWWRRRNKVLVLVMTIYHPSYPVLLTYRKVYLSKCTTNV